VFMRISRRPSQPRDFTTCLRCGTAIPEKASGAAMRICLICYARHLNNNFRQAREIEIDNPEPTKRF